MQIKESEDNDLNPYGEDSNPNLRDSNPWLSALILSSLGIQISWMEILIHPSKQTLLESRFESVVQGFESWSSSKLTGIRIRILSMGIRITFFFCLNCSNFDEML